MAGRKTSKYSREEGKEYDKFRKYKIQRNKMAARKRKGKESHETEPKSCTKSKQESRRKQKPISGEKK